MAVISTGMGAPSADIIINELVNLGARNLIRIGTSRLPAAGTCAGGFRCGAYRQRKGRDDTGRYLPAEVPAVPSLSSWSQHITGRR